MIEESYVSFETARMLEKAGFDEPCEWSYNEKGKLSVTHAINSTLPKGHVSRPTQALAARWLREVHKIHISSEIMVFPVFDRVGGKEVGERISWGYYVIPTERGAPITENNEEFNTYESALEAGLRRGLELIKELSS